MARFIAWRIVRAILTLWLSVTVVFLVLRLAGDPLRVLLPDNAPQNIRDFYVEKWGLNEPIPVQYARYFLNVFQGNLGQSYYGGQDVTVVIAERLPFTLLLGTSALFLGVTIGLGLGIGAVLNRGGWLDRIVLFGSTVGYSLPNYFLGICLIIVFSLYLRWLPSSGSNSWQALIMPLITLSAAIGSLFARHTRSALIEILNEPYLVTARSKGLRNRQVLFTHALRNALLPLVTLLGFQVGYLVGGSAVVETIFAWPGIGRLFVQAVTRRDLALVQGIVLLIAFSVTFTNTTVDIAYGLIDPRIRRGTNGG